MTAPKRIQLRRTKGWRKPENAVVVARPSKWGNPYRPVQFGIGLWVAEDDNGIQYPGYGPVAPGVWRTRKDALRDCVRLYRQIEAGYRLGVLADVESLRGKDLGCWCPLDQPCHADVLLELANGDDR